MKSPIPWILAGVGAGAATYLLLRQPTTSQYATGYSGVDDAANRTALWGDKQRVAGSGTNLVGNIKEGIGRLTGNDDLATEGAADQAAGTVRNAAGAVANAAGKTLKDLNF